MLVLAVGALDLVDAITPAPTTSVEDALAALEDALQAITDAIALLFPHGVYVYVLDYPDASNGYGFISPSSLSCDAPFDALLNVAMPVPSAWTHTLKALSTVAAHGAVDQGFAFVPLRFLLGRLGGNRDLIRAEPPAFEDTVASHHDDVFASDCWSLNAEGHRKIADVIRAFLQHQSVLQYI